MNSYELLADVYLPSWHAGSPAALDSAVAALQLCNTLVHPPVPGGVPRNYYQVLGIGKEIYLEFIRITRICNEFLSIF